VNFSGPNTVVIPTEARALARADRGIWPTQPTSITREMKPAASVFVSADGILAGTARFLGRPSRKGAKASVEMTARGWIGIR